MKTNGKEVKGNGKEMGEKRNEKRKEWERREEEWERRERNGKEEKRNGKEVNSCPIKKINHCKYFNVLKVKQLRLQTFFFFFFCTLWSGGGGGGGGGICTSNYHAIQCIGFQITAFGKFTPILVYVIHGWGIMSVGVWRC